MKTYTGIITFKEGITDIPYISAYTMLIYNTPYYIEPIRNYLLQTVEPIQYSICDLNRKELAVWSQSTLRTLWRQQQVETVTHNDEKWM